MCQEDLLKDFKKAFPYNKSISLLTKIRLTCICIVLISTAKCPALYWKLLQLLMSYREAREMKYIVVNAFNSRNTN